MVAPSRVLPSARTDAICVNTLFVGLASGLIAEDAETPQLGRPENRPQDGSATALPRVDGGARLWRSHIASGGASGSLITAQAIL